MASMPEQKPPQVPRVKLSLSIEGLPWERHAGVMHLATEQELQEAQVAVQLNGHLIFAGKAASLIQVFPSGPPHVALQGGVVKLDAIEWEAVPAEQPVIPGVPPVPPSTSNGSAGGGAVGSN